MIRTASTSDVLAAIGRARTVLLSAYVLGRHGAVLDAAEAAARRGARVTVRIEGRPLPNIDPVEQAKVTARNYAAAAELRAAGADAVLVDTSDSNGPPLHLKAVVCDGVAYLDDRNWPRDGEDTILRDDFRGDVAAIKGALLRKHAPAAKWFWTTKRGALAAEARLLYGAQHATAVDVESESFGYGGGAYGALKRLAQAGVHCRLLVSQHDLKTKSQAALQELERDGVQVRVGDFDEKLAVVDDARAWTGSANSTWGSPDTIDWGVRTDAGDVVNTLESHFQSQWDQSSAI